jgi:hypothetical protein
MAPTTLTTITAPPRYDGFTAIHKALRRELFEAAIAVARADFASPEETAAAARSVEVCLAHLREHAEHEDRRIMPAVHELAPALADDLAHDHVALERAAIEVERLFPKLGTLDAAGRVALGAELVRRFNAYVAHQLRHMEREEREVLAVFWERLDDAAIAAMNARVIADIGPARMAEWGALIGPAINRAEREAMEAARARAAAA